MDGARYLVYSVTKTFLAVLFGLLVGHGGGGPGYAAAAFALARNDDDPPVAVELTGDERVDVQSAALRVLRAT